MSESNSSSLVSVVMGSKSDFPTMRGSVDALNHFGIPHEVDIVSAHRTPERLFEYSSALLERGIKVVIAGAGGAAHLPGMIAARTVLPVIGVPISATKMEGVDSLLSIVQMPAGVPVATVAINNAENAAILAVQIIGAFDANTTDKLLLHKEGLKEKVTKSALTLREQLK
jgi:phosphoribosylaminoimidazole carboxylase PurE protein